ncbi:MAG TPA: nitroreductase family protein [Miltoncostaeaceae bacterium]|nr:nitroreductase family protein [Miltoncostaeaceae bacterium]
MDALEAIRKRRAVRTYTDQPVDDETIDRLLRLALRAPTGGNAQAWSLLVVRDADRRREVAELVIAGGARYFALMRPPAEGNSPEQHAEWARGYAEQVLGSYRQVPVWVVGLVVPRGNYPPEMREAGAVDDLLSLGFAMQNLFIAARAMGLGTVPTTAFQRFELDRLRGVLDLPAEVDPAILTPLGYPPSFPEGLPPALKKNRRPWRSLVHDDSWGRTRA